MNESSSLPVWAKARELREMTGLNRTQLNRLVSEGKVCAKRLEYTVLYRVADVLSAIDALPNK